MLAVRPGAGAGAVEWCLRGGLWPLGCPRRGFEVFGGVGRRRRWGAGRGRGVIKRVSKSALFKSFVDHGGGRT